jgi:hypothetical protein
MHKLKPIFMSMGGPQAHVNSEHEQRQKPTESAQAIILKCD